MHRHGYQGRKFGRERDQRRALIKGIASALVEYEAVETTLPKAKEVVPYMEKLITKAKKGTLHDRRQIMASLTTEANAHKLIDEIAPKLSARNSGHLRIEKTRLRRGDLAQMAKISFVDDLSKEAPKPAAPKVEKSKISSVKSTPKKSVTKTTASKPKAKTATAKKKITKEPKS